MSGNGHSSLDRARRNHLKLITAIVAVITSCGVLVTEQLTAAAATDTPATSPSTILQTSTPQSDPMDPQVSSVACPTTGSCFAVGLYDDTNGSQQGLIETLLGGTWTPTEAPLPSDARVAQPDANLLSVACTGAGSCVAVGNYYVADNSYSGLIETLSNGTWTPIEAPLPAGTVNDQTVDLASVSCGGSGSCAAVGDYHDVNNGGHLLIETLSGGTWTATEAPLPSGASTSQNGGFYSSSVDCPDVGACVAVGSYTETDDSGNQLGLIETLSGGEWTGTEAPLPSGATTAQLQAVACHSAGSCAAVGSSADANAAVGGRQGFIENLSGGTWTPTAAPSTRGRSERGPPGHNVPLSRLVSCRWILLRLQRPTGPHRCPVGRDVDPDGRASTRGRSERAAPVHNVPLSRLVSCRWILLLRLQLPTGPHRCPVGRDVDPDGRALANRR